MRSNAVDMKKPAVYGRFLLFVAGLGGLLYGIDVGIISSALLYLSKTVDLTEAQTSAIVAAVLGGSTVSSLVAGFLADWLGRKVMMVISGLLFVTSVILIVISHGFVSLFLGRLLQGLSGGVIAVVVPLYLAECLSAKTRGRGSAVFQFMLTFGIVASALIGLLYISGADAAIARAHGNAAAIHAAEDHAWRGMFLAVVYPGMAFLLGTLFLSETPRWLFRRGQRDAAYAVLLRSTSRDEADLEIREMSTLAPESSQGKTGMGSLLQRRYVFPFVLACAILALNQSTGINSVLAYLSVILQQAGMTARHAAQGDLLVKCLNCVMTIIAIVLIDRKGRKALLSFGTGGIVVAMLLVSFLFYRFESHRIDVRQPVGELIAHGHRVLTPADVRALSGQDGDAVSLRVLYSAGHGDRIATVFGNANDSADLQPDDKDGAPLVIKHAFLCPLPSQSSGWWVTLGLALFITCYSVGPGVVVWLTLSELMPTRIRSAGMGIALLLNQSVSTLIAGVFLPVVSRYGYYAMFFFWATCTLVYFSIAAFLLPETKGKTLEEIEASFA